jgi:hypothetical protein
LLADFSRSDRPVLEFLLRACGRGCRRLMRRSRGATTGANARSS